MGGGAGGNGVLAGASVGVAGKAAGDAGAVAGNAGACAVAAGVGVAGAGSGWPAQPAAITAAAAAKSIPALNATRIIRLNSQVRFGWQVAALGDSGAGGVGLARAGCR